MAKIARFEALSAALRPADCIEHLICYPKGAVPNSNHPSRAIRSEPGNSGIYRDAVPPNPSPC